MVDLALNNDMLVAAGTLKCAQATRIKEQKDMFLVKWESNALQYPYVFNLTHSVYEHRKVTPLSHCAVLQS